MSKIFSPDAMPSMTTKPIPTGSIYKATILQQENQVKLQNKLAQSGGVKKRRHKKSIRCLRFSKRKSHKRRYRK